MKKGEITWDFIGKIILALVVLFIVIYLVFLLKDKFAEFISNLPRLFRTG